MDQAHLLKIRISGKDIDFYRDYETKEVKVCNDKFCAIIPQGSGETTINLVSILSELGEIIDMEEEDDKQMDRQVL